MSHFSKLVKLSLRIFFFLSIGQICFSADQPLTHFVFDEGGFQKVMSQNNPAEVRRFIFEYTDQATYEAMYDYCKKNQILVTSFPLLRLRMLLLPKTQSEAAPKSFSELKEMKRVDIEAAMKITIPEFLKSNMYNEGKALYELINKTKSNAESPDKAITKLIKKANMMQNLFYGLCGLQIVSFLVIFLVV